LPSGGRRRERKKSGKKKRSSDRGDNAIAFPSRPSGREELKRKVALSANNVVGREREEIQRGGRGAPETTTWRRRERTKWAFCITSLIHLLPPALWRALGEKGGDGGIESLLLSFEGGRKRIG